MASKIKIRFSLISSGKQSDEKQIFLVYTIDGIENFYYSGYRIYPKNFIKEKTELSGETVYIQQAKKNTFNKSGDSSTRINNRLKKLALAVQTVFDRYYKDQDLPIDKKELKKYLQIELGEYKEDIEFPKLSILEAYDKYYIESNVSDSRKKQYKSDRKRIANYIDENNCKINFDNFDVLKFRNFLISKSNISENTLVIISKRIKAFFNYCKNRLKIIDHNPFEDIIFSKDIGIETYQEPICMTRDELTKLYYYNPSNRHKEVIKDMFCLQASLGCRVGDFLRLTYSNIQDNKLIYFPKKIDGNMMKVIVPLSKRAMDIINKYKGHSRGDLLMPFMNSVEYNSSLKIVFEEAKLNRIVVLYNREKKIEEYKKLYELASSHLARRTFVDILCQAGEPIHVVASMSGHSENSKAFDRYRRRPEQLQINAVNRSMD